MVRLLVVVIVACTAAYGHIPNEDIDESQYHLIPSKMRVSFLQDLEEEKDGSKLEESDAEVGEDIPWGQPLIECRHHWCCHETTDCCGKWFCCSKPDEKHKWKIMGWWCALKDRPYNVI